MTQRPDDTFSPEEQQALDVWQVPSPPADLTRAVLARAKQRSRRRLLIVSSAAAVLISTIALVSLRRSATHGEHQASSRTTLQLADRAVVVAEADSHLKWQIKSGGAASVTQDSGNVFYRVESGERFVVTTPRGTVKVLGTCFRVQVRDADVRLSVHEGKVFSASLDGDGIEVSAGKIALMDDGTPTIVGDMTSGEDKAMARDKRSSRPLVLSGNLQQQNSQLLRRNRELESELAELRDRLDKSDGQAKKMRFLDLTTEDKTAMAKRCELRWDNPCYGSEAPTITPRDQRKVGLTDAEVKMANAVLKEQFAWAHAETAKLYVELTGDTNGVDTLSPSSMSNEIMDKSPRPEMRLVYQRLARERAGLQTPPADTSTGSALERLMRILTVIGDRTEKAMGAKIGPDLARRYRALHGGFSNKSRSSHGCPGE